jgi:hypothetical protein
MSIHRHNKSAAFRPGDQPWFVANVRRQRRRRDLAYETRRRNR